MNQTPNQFRILAVSLSSRGFGYAVMEGEDRLVDYGKKIIAADKNARSLAHIETMIARNQPDVLVLHNVHAAGTHRNPRIKRLHRSAVVLAKRHKLRVVTISGMELRSTLLGNEAGTKQEMAEALARKFPEELAARLPPKRKTWASEDARMDTFDAVGLAVVFGLKGMVTAAVK
jgi:RNase H-fold protein (predicted Holliday junction resolvase)